MTARGAGRPASFLSFGSLVAVLGVAMVLVSGCSNDSSDAAPSATTGRSPITEESGGTEPNPEDGDETGPDSAEAASNDGGSVCAQSSSTTATSADVSVGGADVEMAVDLDGDGSDEYVSVVASDGWHVVAEGSSLSSSVQLSGGADTVEARLVGGADVDGDGSQELFVATGGGAYVTELALLGYDECGLFEYALADESPVRFYSGASVGNGEAVLCSGDGLIEQFFWSLVPGSGDLGSSDSDLEFEAGFVSYALSGATLEETEGQTSVVNTDAVSAIPLFDCLGLELTS